MQLRQPRRLLTIAATIPAAIATAQGGYWGGLRSSGAECPSAAAVRSASAASLLQLAHACTCQPPAYHNRMRCHACARGWTLPSFCPRPHALRCSQQGLFRGVLRLTHLWPPASSMRAPCSQAALSLGELTCRNPCCLSHACKFQALAVVLALEVHVVEPRTFQRWKALQTHF